MHDVLQMTARANGGRQGLRLSLQRLTPQSDADEERRGLHYMTIVAAMNATEYCAVVNTCTLSNIMTRHSAPKVRQKHGSAWIP